MSYFERQVPMGGFIRQFLAVSQSRTAFTTNLLSLIFSLLAIVLAFILIALFGWLTTTPYIFAMAALFWLVIFLVKAGYDTAGRLLFCLMPVWFVLGISILGKFSSDQQSYIIYFDARFILLATSVLPAIVFEFNERGKLAICMVSTLICLMLFDPIHNFFGVGYYQRGFDAASYYYINYVTFISFVALVSGILVLKWRHGRASQKALRALTENLRIARQLQLRNDDLQNATHEMEAQNEEILQQQEEMVTSHEMLEKANQMISEQKGKLEEYNLHLEQLVEEKSGDLLKTNEELIKSNNELRQFSFTVSHNLRGPVARLLGLTRLMDAQGRPEDIAQMMKFIHQSATELDGILRDLSTIIDVRSDLYRVREKINLDEEWRKALMLLGEQSLTGVHVHTDFRASPHIFGIKPMVQSILFNLVNNAIKYRAPDRPLSIMATARFATTNSIAVDIVDNGLGIDLATHGENLFKLYKRFHLHVPGKGMGLYLVRSQMEIMGGRVEVESRPDKGALFRLYFPVPADLDRQVFFENDAAQLYYDAHINNTVIIWKRNVTSEEYRKAFEAVLQTIKKYNTPGWIADLRNQGVIAPEDQQWFLESVLQAAADNGLVRIGTIGFKDPIRKDYFERMIAKTAEFGIELRLFEEMDNAVLWMKRFAQ